MFRALRLLFLAALAVVLVTIAMANRPPVTLRLLPQEAGDFLGYTWTVQLPLFLVIFGGILVGLLIGFVWEWMRESRHRSAASKNARQVARLQREVSKLKGADPEQKDEVLALLENSAKPAR
ncbi:DUF1049 domain-containing protein [Rhodobacter veldkampii DSM 11550]|uniref:DUF1049 domain-containing protein n=1 Tax=Phaeovulum veldkampii DSM 11550 TaxID=1185920 RepID=A0A2T4JLT6_9RHOB|nr:LapA family protein [Phaeovulum veldkampii]MBK5946602.1 DUF1049 domain-containing protein [Phaeovulum veldkampii DSM 11550]PTE18880.1 DUF1049 domain-containing protein [Phaeovulum veldkampii DSM 11550]TDQ59937.1 uncharacterized protein DUF1049 [Phaeovulum veldkampii DSM 11550]